MAAHPELTTEALSGGPEVLDALSDEWLTLCRDSHYDEPFHRPELIRAYVEAFAPESTLVIFAVRQGRRLVAILPLVRERTMIGGIPARVLRSAGNVHTCRFDLVHLPHLQDAVVTAIWHALKREGGWDALEFSAVPARSVIPRLIRLARSDGFPAHAVRAATSPYVRLPQEDGNTSVLERLDPKFRANLRRRMRKLQSRGKVRLTCSTRPDATLQQFYDLEQAGWKGRARTAILHDRPAHQYYDALARAASRCGYFSLYRLECGEQAVAMQYGLTHAGRYFLLKTAYDESLRECSPGHLVTLEILQELARRGCVEFDFLGLPMDWKRDWAPRLRPHANWYVFRGALGSVLHLVHARARRFAGRTMRRRRVPGKRPAQTGSGER